MPAMETASDDDLLAAALSCRRQMMPSDSSIGSSQTKIRTDHDKTLCEYCCTISYKLFSNRRDQQCSHHHHPSVSALRESAALGCRLCSLFSQALERSTGRYAPLKKWTEDQPIQLLSTKFNSRLLCVNWRDAGVFNGRHIPDDWTEKPPDVGMSEADYLQHEARLLRVWMDKCFNEHKKCGHTLDFVPRRLLDVGTASDPSLNLVETTAAAVPVDYQYLALSHCWGLTMPQAAKLTTAQLTQYKSEVPYSMLPRTFRDAVDITRRLAVRYVWIDSLCIIQDSKEDWEDQAAQMADVYSKSLLTLAASGSSDGRGGCRVTHTRRSYGPVDIECLIPDKKEVADQSKDTFSFRLWTREPDPVGEVLTNDPLHKRGWTLQERELSPRIAHYSHDTVRWECNELWASLEYPWGDVPAFDAGRLYDGGREARPTLIGPMRNDSKTLDQVTKERLCWFELVERYTQRALTKETDMLPAIAGIATAVARSTEDIYCAGLWRSHMAQSLLWCRPRHSSTHVKHFRPDTYLAPSWSWASLRGPVKYINGDWTTYNASPDPAFLPTFDEVVFEPPGKNYTGMERGMIRVSSRVAMGYTPSGPTACELWSLTANGGVDAIGTMDWDVPLCNDCSPPGQKRPVLLLCCMVDEPTKNGEVRTYALALEPENLGVVPETEAQPVVTGAMAFKRVGLASRIAASFWDRAISMTLDLV